jgi:hypothetical protein
LTVVGTVTVAVVAVVPVVPLISVIVTVVPEIAFTCPRANVRPVGWIVDVHQALLPV